MKKLQLSKRDKKGMKYKGKEALIDDDIFHIVNRYNWSYTYGSNKKKGYAKQRTMNIYLHQFIWNLKVGNIPKGFYVDHIDGNGLNCQIDNLRLATKSENCCNVGPRKDNKSGYKGISKEISYGHPRKDGTRKKYIRWNASVTKDGKTYTKRKPYTNSGLKEAIEWQKEMEKKLHKEYAFSNRPEDTKE